MRSHYLEAVRSSVLFEAFGRTVVYQTVYLVADKHATDVFTSLDAAGLPNLVSLELPDVVQAFFVQTILAALISATVVCEALFAPFVIATLYGAFFENSD